MVAVAMVVTPKLLEATFLEHVMPSRWRSDQRNTFFFRGRNSRNFLWCWLLIVNFCIGFGGRSLFSCFFGVFFLCWMRICCLSLCFKTGEIQQDGLWLLKESGEGRSIAGKQMSDLKWVHYHQWGGSAEMREFMGILHPNKNIKGFIMQGSVHHPFVGDQTMQIGFPS